MRAALILLVLLTAGAGGLWLALLRPSSGLDELATASAPSAASDERAPALDGALPAGVPRTLVAARALWEHDALAAARRGLEAELARAPRPEREGLLRLLLSEVARRSGEPAAAYEAARRAVELLPESADAHHVLSRALGARMQTGGMLAAMGKFGEYQAELARAIELDPAHVDALCDRVFVACFTPGFAGGDPERGLEHARDLARLDPARGALMQVVALRALERTDEALALCDSALAAHPECDDLRYSYGDLLCELERHQEADAQLARIDRAREPGTWYMALYRRAKLRLQGGFEEQRAVELLDEYLAADPRGEMLPRPAGARWRRGQALEALGRDEEARREYERALELDPELEAAQEALEALDAGG